MIKNEMALYKGMACGVKVSKYGLEHGYLDYKALHGYEILREFTDELVFYNEDLNLYLWGITHFGTAWDHVLTDVKLV